MSRSAAVPDRPARADSDPVAELCSEYGYPPEVADVLRRVVNVLRPLHPISLFLHGSTARGELTWWRDEAGRVGVGSDVELYAVSAELPPARMRATASRALDALAAEVNAGRAPLFHVDVGHTTPERFRLHPRTFRLWDTRETGRVLLGEDVRALLPVLGPADIDLRQLNEVPIHRLWEMVFRVPRSLLEGTARPVDERLFALVCARQALDLTTWLLPHFGILVPTFGRRVGVWEERFPGTPLAHYFAPESGAFLRECLEAKLRLHLHRDAREMHGEVLEHFRSALRLLLALEPQASDLAIADGVRRQGNRHWNDQPPRQKAYHGYAALRAGASPHRAVGYGFARKRPLQVGALLLLNAALAELLHGGASPSLGAAEDLLRRLWCGYTPVDASPVERFLTARRGYVDFLTRTSRWFGPRRDYLLSVIGDQDVK